MSGHCVTDEHEHCPNLHDSCSCPCHLFDTPNEYRATSAATSL